MALNIIISRRNIFVGTADGAVVEFVNRSTRTGTLVSSLGAFALSGNRQEPLYSSVIRVKDGKFIKRRDHHEAAMIARQLGLTE